MQLVANTSIPALIPAGHVELDTRQLLDTADGRSANRMKQDMSTARARSNSRVASCTWRLAWRIGQDARTAAGWDSWTCWNTAVDRRALFRWKNKQTKAKRSGMRFKLAEQYPFTQNGSPK